jgi:hypothetical protein
MPWRRVGEWRYSSTILDLGTVWRRVVSFTPRQLYPRGNRQHSPLDTRLGGPYSRSGCWGEEKYQDIAGIRILAVQPVARWYSNGAIPTKSTVHKSLPLDSIYIQFNSVHTRTSSLSLFSLSLSLSLYIYIYVLPIIIIKYSNASRNKKFVKSYRWHLGYFIFLIPVALFYVALVTFPP